MENLGSVTMWIDHLKSGKGREEAVLQLWGRYFTQLVSRARERLKLRSPVLDGEDVALDAFDSFVRAAEAGRFPRLDHRDDLWQILLMLTVRKVSNVMRDEGRLKKGGHAAIVRLGNTDSVTGGIALPSHEPDPAEAAVLAEEADHLLRALDSDELRTIAVWALEGYSNEEIARRLGRSVATAERKLRRIRDRWKELAG